MNDNRVLLETCNPNHLLYGICIKIKDVIENPPLQGNNNESMHLTALHEKSFWVTNKVFCFFTYYPFIKFFLDILASILNQMKMKKVEFYS